MPKRLLTITGDGDRIATAVRPLLRERYRLRLADVHAPTDDPAGDEYLQLDVTGDSILGQSRGLARWPIGPALCTQLLQALRSRDRAPFQSPLINPGGRFSRTRLSEIFPRVAIGVAAYHLTVPTKRYTPSFLKYA